MQTVTVKFDDKYLTVLRSAAEDAWDRGDIDAFTPVRTVIAALRRSPDGVAWVELSVTSARALARVANFFSVKEALDGVREEPQRQDRPSVRKSRRFL